MSFNKPKAQHMTQAHKPKHSFIENWEVGNKAVYEMTYMSNHLQFIVKPLNYLNELNIYIVHTS